MFSNTQFSILKMKVYFIELSSIVQHCFYYPTMAKTAEEKARSKAEKDAVCDSSGCLGKFTVSAFRAWTMLEGLG